LQDSLFNCKNIEFIWNTAVDEIYGKFDVEGIKIKNIITGEMSNLKVDGVFVAIGNVPHTHLVQGKIELNKAGYIVTDENMQTNIFGVFAAGDIREKSLRQVITAASDGAIAAYIAERYINENRW